MNSHGAERRVTVYPALRFRRNQPVLNQATGRFEHISQPGFSPLGTSAYTTDESGDAFSEDTFVPVSDIIPALFRNLIPFISEKMSRR